MCIYRDFWQEWEKKSLAPYAVHSDDQWYSQRSTPEVDNPLDPHGSESRYRTPFEIDKDRIVKSQAFRRMEYKTQVFVTHEGDHFRTRLTHSLEVAEIARHIARALRLNEHLVEAIALGHDLGHAPYGHVAEEAINEWFQAQTLRWRIQHGYEKFPYLFYFCHNRHSVENVEHLEPGYDWDDRSVSNPNDGFGKGLNLTRGVREGLLVHTSRGYRGKIQLDLDVPKIIGRYEDLFRFEDDIQELSHSNEGKGLYYPGSIEAQVVRIADELAQRIHDLEDGLRSNVLEKSLIVEAIDSFFQNDWDEQIEKQVRKYHNKNYGGNMVINEPANLFGYSSKSHRIEISYLHLQWVVIIANAQVEAETKRMVDGFSQNEFDLSKNRDRNEIRKAFNKIQPTKRKDYLKRAAQIAFLLHMWRDRDYLLEQSPESAFDWVKRIAKYLNLLNKIVDFHAGQVDQLPSHHIMGFLRGVMFANVIEHSYWSIHSRLDPRSTSEKSAEKPQQRFEKRLERLFDPKNSGEKILDKKYYAVFVIVDGLTETKGDDNFIFHAREAGKNSLGCKRFYCYQFEKEPPLDTFMNENIQNVLQTNGLALMNAGEINAHGKFKQPDIERVVWINKAENTWKTEYFGIKVKNEDTYRIVPIDQVKVVFTGYLYQCPGNPYEDYDEPTGHEMCLYQKRGGCDNKRCPFYAVDSVSRPDIRRLVEFHQQVNKLDQKLEYLITSRIHQGSRVSRMNYMGEKIVMELLDAYLKNPHLMHERVWAFLREYHCSTRNDEDISISTNIKKWCEKTIIDKEKNLFKDEWLQELKSYPAERESAGNLYILLRRIVEHVAGMTDRFLANEYNRLTQSGREVEIPDETYFVF